MPCDWVNPDYLKVLKAVPKIRLIDRQVRLFYDAALETPQVPSYPDCGHFLLKVYERPLRPLLGPGRDFWSLEDDPARATPLNRWLATPEAYDAVVSVWLNMLLVAEPCAGLECWHRGDEFIVDPSPVFIIPF